MDKSHQIVMGRLADSVGGMWYSYLGVVSLSTTLGVKIT